MLRLRISPLHFTVFYLSWKWLSWVNLVMCWMTKLLLAHLTLSILSSWGMKVKAPLFLALTFIQWARSSRGPTEDDPEWHLSCRTKITTRVALSHHVHYPEWVNAELPRGTYPVLCGRCKLLHVSQWLISQVSSEPAFRVFSWASSSYSLGFPLEDICGLAERLWLVCSYVSVI